MRCVLLLELNEVNFDYVRAYVERGELPTFKHLLDTYGCSETTSEESYEQLEPWIQWVTAHTGKTLAEHRVFRLGDIDHLNGVEQIWERLERERSVRVGAISPMNAANRISRGFFVPDPWTATPATGSYLLRQMSRAVGQAVNESAKGRLTIGSLFWLAAGAAANARFTNYGEYVRLLARAVRWPWTRALFLDLLLADTFISQVAASSPGFASVFLNAAAHIQHHYLFSSTVYRGPNKNPSWYVPSGEDPLLEVYRVYDRIIRNVVARFPRHRVMIATGLHQDPHDQVTFYWRLRDHAGFLRKVKVPFVQVHPRMSRDFLVVCRDEADAHMAERILNGLRDSRGNAVFEVDNRGVDLFVMLSYAGDIGKDFVMHAADGVFEGFCNDVVFVALKNGQHNGIGYFIDTGAPKNASPPVFALKELPDRILSAV